MQLKPLRNLVAVQPDQEKTQTDSGILLPYQAMKKAHVGTVVETGPGYWNEKNELVPTGVNAGDRVMFNPEDATYVIVDGVEIAILSSANIVGVLV